MDFTKDDVAHIEKKGLSTREVEKQIDIFRRGNIVVNIREAATTKNGILSFSDEEAEELRHVYDTKRDSLDILKFVPASGAATRMFKAFYNFVEEYDPKKETLDDFLDQKDNSNLAMFFNKLENLPFYEEVKQKAQELNPNFNELSHDEQSYYFVKTMLDEDGANLGELPKGLVPFHRYENYSVTAFEEHLIEAADYASSNGKARLHFTVAEEHRQKFEEEFTKVRKRVEAQTGLKYEVSYSYQDPKTDTVAVTMENEPFRDEEGNIFFRPGGHGALIENLNNCEADLLFIKNIDNVVTPKYRHLLADNKKMLAGKLLQLQKRAYSYLQKLEDDNISDDALEEIIPFMQKELNSGLGIEFKNLGKKEKVAALKQKLNRPMRVCGIVKNEGEPGGGPFWVTHKNGDISLQIVESSQIDHDNYQQSKIAKEATHFNPVDVVCSKRDYKGENFDLKKYVDEETSFIAEKTKDGKDLKALERPGLWNGGMADWITVFVEVPVETFNPVKTVADLLKQSHQVS